MRQQKNDDDVSWIFAFKVEEVALEDYEYSTVVGQEIRVCLTK